MYALLTSTLCYWLCTAITSCCIIQKSDSSVFCIRTINHLRSHGSWSLMSIWDALITCEQFHIYIVVLKHTLITWHIEEAQDIPKSGVPWGPRLPNTDIGLQWRCKHNNGANECVAYILCFFIRYAELYGFSIIQIQYYRMFHVAHLQVFWL